MIKVTLNDNHYNQLPFYFDSIEEIGDILFLALKEGYEAKIENATEEPPEAEAV